MPDERMLRVWVEKMLTHWGYEGGVECGITTLEMKKRKDVVIVIVYIYK